MALRNDRYTYRVTWSPEDGEYVGLCAEFPGLSWLAAAPEAALNGIRKAVAEVVKDLKTDRETVPEPLASRRFAASSWCTCRRRFTATSPSKPRRPG